MSGPLPLVSVITVCLNSEKTIRHTIESILNQTYQNIEYIVVDGDSTDGTLSIINEYREKIAVLISEKDRGISDAFNKGIGLAKGTFIQMINSDDTLDKHKVGKSVEILTNMPSAAYVFGDLHIIGKNARCVRGDADYVRSIHYGMPRLNHPTILVRKSAFDKYGYFDLRWRIAMDYEFLLRIHRAGERGVYSSEVIALMNAGGLSERAAMLAFKEVREISIINGFNPLLAYLYYYARCVKHYIYLRIGLR